MEIEKPKKLENLTEQDIQDWVRWALEQANKINQEEETKWNTQYMKSTVSKLTASHATY